MRILPGQVVLLTGASGGLGEVMAREFARRGLNLVLNAYPGLELKALHTEVEKLGIRAVHVISDLRLPQERQALVEKTLENFGAIDILVNNAGVEFTAPFHQLTEEQISDVISVNLTAAMMLTRLVLPHMLKRQRGHIVQISSLAGKSGPAYQEPYAATKAGLVAFTSSLRGTYANSGVGASVIVPGFVEAGIYARLKSSSGCEAPAFIRGTRPEQVAAAIVKAVERNIAEIIVNPYPLRPVLALTALSPALGAWIAEKIGSDDFFRAVFAAQQNKSGAGSAPVTEGDGR